MALQRESQDQRIHRRLGGKLEFHNLFKTIKLKQNVIYDNLNNEIRMISIDTK